MATPGGTRASQDAISELVKVLVEDQKFTSIEIAETLWLALQLEPAAVIAPDESPPPGRETPTELPIHDDLPQDNPVTSPPPTPPPRVNLSTPAPEAGVLPTEALPVWIADPALLTDPLAVIRALKPLLQQVDAGIGRRLDEPATVERIARTRLWLPILKPERAPWFDIVLVVDQSSSMHLWARLVKDIVRTLRSYGAFRDVQVFDLEVNCQTAQDEDGVLLKSHSDRPGHRPSEIIDKRGQRIVMLLSDCAGGYWWDGILLPTVKEWASSMPTVIWQMLPEWMWERTALGRGTAVALSTNIPGAASQQLTVRVLDRDVPEEDTLDRVAVPVVTSEVRELANWSLMLAGDRREVTPGFLLPHREGGVPKARTLEEIAQDRLTQLGEIESDSDRHAALSREIEGIARERVQRFRELASPYARRLVMLLAAAPVITPPVMRLIRDSMLYEATSPLPVAEVFLSGLLERLPGQEDVEPELMQYDFVPKVREILLKVLPPVDTIKVLNEVSALVEERWNKYSSQNFLAFLKNPRIETPAGLEGIRSFASVTADIVEQLELGGKYDILVQELRQGAGEEPPPDETRAAADSFPSFEPFNFIEAQFDEDAFPPPLQAGEFTIITFEVQQEAEANEGLELFEFTVATLQRGSTERRSVEPRRGLFGNLFNDRSQQNIPEWKVHWQQQQAYRLIEALPSDIPLEMVAIPGGTFLMGSPNDEPERSRNTESPLHEVSIESFFIGRYPVTQAQWQAVASLPRVKRQLKRNPSRFKSDNRPVERVYWNDAVEFCARLSVHTGRQYRLPTEAEWEYACRAGTTTPFHFGETLTTEVANYDGTATYADGPKGERRNETTPVDHFGIANAFGLTDMHGNVWEWCQDPWHDNYNGAPPDGSAWIQEGGYLPSRVLRGGSWNNLPSGCRSASRNNGDPDLRFFNFGFRVCCAAPRT